MIADKKADLLQECRKSAFYESMVAQKNDSVTTLLLILLDADPIIRFTYDSEYKK